ncbi:AEC family transporter [Paenibacillus sp. Y412MC10]|uniref:AEC family transporter n=1 Tax=Geobacillus sp. (strain Y412MC10) TaxID=481743 RepID=UPI0001788D4C|nr:AEC family transporter [Paenibacillus sp. Y412MC10]ACX67381.1 Auxin Efflux Carrier [Paenibacillus sp. Y412MC10]
MISSFLATIYSVFLPISLPVIGGALLKRFKGIETKGLSALSLYVLSPALIFETLEKASITSNEVTVTVAFCLLNVIILWALSAFAGKMLGLSQTEKSGLALTTIFTNSVNYGLPLVLLAFGQAGLDKASVYVIVQIIIMNTLGVYLAARSHFSAVKAIKTVFTLPSVYAAAFAVLFRLTDFQLPEGLNTGVSMLSATYAPLALVILGAQMVGVREGGASLAVSKRGFWSGMAMRMLVGPLVAWGLLAMLSIEGTLFAVILILSAMPAAVNAVILAEEYDAAPKLVSRCILWTTLASFIVLPAMIGFL